jgi:hypothetical protein
MLRKKGGAMGNPEDNLEANAFIPFDFLFYLVFAFLFFPFLLFPAFYFNFSLTFLSSFFSSHFLCLLSVFFFIGQRASKGPVRAARLYTIDSWRTLNQWKPRGGPREG